MISEDSNRLSLLGLFAAVILTLLVGAQAGSPATTRKIRIACVGASITAGYGTTNHAMQSYPTQMQAILGGNYEVRNFGVCGTTMLKHGNSPYWDTAAFQPAHDFGPDIVVINLGGNDSKATNWVHGTEFAADSKAMIESFRSLPSHPRVLLCVPTPCFNPPSEGINDENIRQEIPIIQRIAGETGVEVIDLHAAFLDRKDWFADGIHPNAEGHALLAKIVGRKIANVAE